MAKRKTGPKRITTMRLPDDMLDDADDLVAWVAAHMPELAAGAEVTRSTVLRLALIRGLASLKQERAKGKKR